MDISATGFSPAGLSSYNPAQRKDEKSNGPNQQLSEEEQKKVDELKARDREVRAHEAAHMAAAGGHAKGGANFSYQRGPDGRNYAVGGEVSIDTSKVAGDPEATLQKAQQVQQAALAPAEPSGQDRQVAAEAAAMAAEARQEIARNKSEEMQGDTDSESTNLQNHSPANQLQQRLQADGVYGNQQQSALHLIA